MESVEIQKQLKMTYNELVSYLLEKYGAAKYDYYYTPSCKSKNPKISRTSEGLFCHHIDEDKAILLSHSDHAIKNSFEYQKAHRLVYCNILEHLILHIKIAEEPRHKDADEGEMLGLGGVIDFMCPQINDFYNGFVFKQQWLINVYSVVAENFNDYIDILKYLLKVLEKQNLSFIDKKFLSVGWGGAFIEKIYSALDSE